MQATKWQRSEAPLQRARVKETDSARADNQAAPQSWLRKVNRDTKRIERKKHRHIQKKNPPKKLKSFRPLCQGIPVVNSTPFQRVKQDTYGHACVQECHAWSHLGQEAEPSRNNLNSPQA